jgi:membrane fusion protein, multidrug efflux system
MNKLLLSFGTASLLVLAACSDDPKPADAPAPPSTPAAAPAAPAAPAGAPLKVATYVVRPSRLAERVSTTGELKANEEIELRSEAAGRLVHLYFREGQEVAAGALLVKINDADLQAELRRAQVQRGLAAQREERVRVLLNEKTVSQQVYDEAAGELKTVDAEIELLEARIEKTEIRAPFAGRIGLRSMSEGSYVTSAVPIASLQDLDPIKLDFAVPEKYSGQIRAGAPIEFSVAGIDTKFRGQVYAVEPRIDSATRSVRLRANAPNPDRLLFPGSFARIELVLAEQTDAIMVPTTALVPGLETTTVFVIEDGKAVARQIETGQRTASDMQVTRGLKVGDMLIVSGLQQMRGGMAVQPAENAAE